MFCHRISGLQRRRPAGVGKTPDLPCEHRTGLRHCLRHASCRQLSDLPAGSSVTKATFSENAFSFDELSDSFYKGQELQLKEGDETNVDINLQRIVSRIEFKAADKIPEDIVRFELAVSNHPDRLDILTGKGIVSAGPNDFSYEFKTEEKDNPVKSIPFIPLFRQAMKRYPSRSRPPVRIIRYCESGQ